VTAATKPTADELGHALFYLPGERIGTRRDPADLTGKLGSDRFVIGEHDGKHHLVMTKTRDRWGAKYLPGKKPASAKGARLKSRKSGWTTSAVMDLSLLLDQLSDKTGMTHDEVFQRLVAGEYSTWYTPPGSWEEFALIGDKTDPEGYGAFLDGMKKWGNWDQPIHPLEAELIDAAARDGALARERGWARYATLNGGSVDYETLRRASPAGMPHEPVLPGFELLHGLPWAPVTFSGRPAFDDVEKRRIVFADLTGPCWWGPHLKTADVPGSHTQFASFSDPRPNVPPTPPRTTSGIFDSPWGTQEAAAAFFRAARDNQQRPNRPTWDQYF